MSLKYASKKRNTAKVPCVVGVSMGRDGGVPWQKSALLREGAGHQDTSSVKRSPHVADTPVGEIRGYAQRQPPTGVGNYLAFGPHLHYGGVAAMASQARCSVFT